MKYICFFGSNGYVGCGYEDFEVFEDTVSNLEIDEYSLNLAYENAESYAYLLGEVTEEEELEYYQQAIDYANWEEISEERFLNATAVYDDLI